MERAAKIFNWFGVLASIILTAGIYLESPDKISIVNFVLIAFPSVLGLAASYKAFQGSVLYWSLGINGLAAFVATFIIIVVLLFGSVATAFVVAIVTVVWLLPGAFNTILCIRVLRDAN